MSNHSENLKNFEYSRLVLNPNDESIVYNKTNDKSHVDAVRNVKLSLICPNCKYKNTETWDNPFPYEGRVLCDSCGCDIVLYENEDNDRISIDNLYNKIQDVDSERYRKSVAKKHSNENFEQLLEEYNHFFKVRTILILLMTAPFYGVLLYYIYSKMIPMVSLFGDGILSVIIQIILTSSTLILLFIYGHNKFTSYNEHFVEVFDVNEKHFDNNFSDYKQFFRFSKVGDMYDCDSFERYEHIEK